jgi:hypothetical protein
LLYYFLIYSEIMGSKRKGFIIIWGLNEAGKNTVSGISCSPYLRADKGNCCLSKKIRICDSLYKPAGSFPVHKGIWVQ